jgi:Uma2 family endonuclease
MTTTTFMTDEDLLRLPKDGYKYEYIDGKLEKTPGSMLYGKIAWRLGCLIAKHLDQIPIAEVYGASAGYRMMSGNLL